MTLAPSSEELVISLLKTTKQVDNLLAKLRKIADRINSRYEPRAEFSRWRDSKDGQNWKKKQYLAQGRCCAICQLQIPLKGSHIDHIEPLSRYPNLALDRPNLRVTCADCNTSKSNKISNVAGECEIKADCEP